MTNPAPPRGSHRVVPAARQGAESRWQSAAQLSRRHPLPTPTVAAETGLGHDHRFFNPPHMPNSWVPDPTRTPATRGDSSLGSRGRDRRGGIRPRNAQQSDARARRLAASGGIEALRTGRALEGTSDGYQLTSRSAGARPARDVASGASSNRNAQSPAPLTTETQRPSHVRTGMRNDRDPER